MAESRFVYVTYIRTTPARLWKALLEPEFTRKYWLGMTQDCEWKKGSEWKMVFPTGKVADTGVVAAIERNKRLVLKWRNEFMPDLKKEGYSLMTCTLEKHGPVVKLTIVHEMAKKKSKFIEAVSGGWPMVLASLKSLLETGKPLRNLRRQH